MFLTDRFLTISRQRFLKPLKFHMMGIFHSQKDNQSLNSLTAGKKVTASNQSEVAQSCPTLYDPNGL